MSLIEAPIGRPVTAAVGAIFVALFGLIAFFRLPVQLTPNVDRPVVTVTTLWEGASPQEVEREIIEEQEDKLKGIEGLWKMSSTAARERAEVTLEFRIDIPISRALLDVSEKLRQVPSYPDNVDQPIVSAGEVEGSSAIAWVVLQRTEDSPLAPEDVPLLQTLMEEEVKPRLERAKGLASVRFFGGREKEVHIRVDPARLASRRLTLLDVRAAVRARNVDVSAGDLEEGKHDFNIRTVGQFRTTEEFGGLLLARRDGQPVFLRDVAEVSYGFKEPEAIVRSMGAPAIAMAAMRQAGTNVIEVMEELKKAISLVNEQILAPRGLRLVQVYDQTEYIFSSMDLVIQNLWLGGSLAIAVLLLFLREVRSTFIVGLAIPLSVVGSFIGLALLGRNLNVISLAGLSFAVGMVVDNSIVVLENIYRHRELGESARDAALRGVREVWGAVAASTLTTLAVFIPVIFVEEEAGQLFRDIAIAISAAIALSMVVSVLFIPAVAAQVLGRREHRRPQRRWLHAPLDLLVTPARGFNAGVVGIVRWVNRSTPRRLATAVVLTAASVVLTWAFIPPSSYLPGGNQNLVIGFMIPPPGYTLPEFTRIARKVESRLSPYWEAEGGLLPPELARPAWYQGERPLPAAENFFFVAFGSNVFMGVASRDPDNVQPLESLLTYAGADVPGAYLFAAQRSLFEQGITSGNSIDLEIGGAEYARIQAAAGALLGAIMADPELGPMPPRPNPANFNLGAPEIRVRIDEARAADLGLRVQDLGFMLQCMIDGAVVSDFREEGFTIDVKLLATGTGPGRIGDLEGLPILTPAGRQVPVSAVATLEETRAPNEIRRVEKRRSIQLVVSPPPGLELSRAMTALEDRVIPGLRAAGAIAPDVTTDLAGTADKLVSTREALQWDLLLAVVICYLLMASLFESFLYPLVILFSVPLAGVGGVLALRVVHDLTGQQMDVLTMLGFVILVGTVVNNAILIVHQALNNLRYGGMDSGEAVAESVRTRIRPIFMTTLTSVFGMLPLVVAPGSGSELYRGLGAVVLGGLVTSTVFTLVLIPALFTLALDATASVRRVLGIGADSGPPAAGPGDVAGPSARQGTFVVLPDDPPGGA